MDDESKRTFWSTVLKEFLSFLIGVLVALGTLFGVGSLATGCAVVKVSGNQGSTDVTTTTSGVDSVNVSIKFNPQISKP